MNKETHQTEKPRRHFFPFFILLVLVALIIWLWPEINKQFTKTQQAVQTYVADIDVFSQKKRDLMEAVSSTQQAARKHLIQYETTLSELIARQESSDAVTNESPSDPTSKILEETEQLIIIANYHVNLGSNVDAAIEALINAQSNLQQVDDDKRLQSLKDSLAESIENLKSTSSTKTSVVLKQLNDFSGQVDTLPLLIDTNMADAKVDILPKSILSADSSWFSFVNEIWLDVRDFIDIQKVNAPEILIPSPSEVFFLRENLKLKFLLMQFSLLSRDHDGFNTNLLTAINWIDQYFDKDSEPVSDLLHTLKGLQDNSTGIEFPDITENLNKIHTYRIKHNEENK